MVSFVVLIVMVLAMRFYLVWQNKRRNSDRSSVAENLQFYDLSDQQNPEFVYVY